MGRSINLRESRNSACKRCAPQDRRQNTADGICKNIMSDSDELPVRCVGKWAYDKIFHLYQYLGIFSRGMQRQWTGLNYVEICSGPGRCVFKETGEEVDGSALAVLNHPAFRNINAALFIDNNAEAVDVLNKRIAGLGLSGRAAAISGDYTDVAGIVTAIQALPGNSLNLVFIDPTDCSVPFDTIRGIIQHLKSVDLIINLPIYMDAGRNLAECATNPAYAPSRGKYESMLGITNFFQSDAVQELAASGNHRALRAEYRRAFRNQLASCGHEHTAEKEVEKLYELVYASRHPRGLEFWDKACGIAPDGQRQLGI